MPEPTHLPSFLSEEPPIPDDDLTMLVEVLGIAATEMATDVESVAAMVLAGEDPTHSGPMVPEIASGYRVESLGEAEWAMRHLREAHACVAEVQSQADQWRAEVDAWADKASRRHLGTAAYMRALLEGYGLAARRADPKAATIALPTGVIETTARKARPVVTDAEVLLAWCQENAPQAVEEIPATHRVPVAAAKELGSIVEDEVTEHADDAPTTTHTVRSFVTSAGTPVPGMDVEPPRVDVKVKPA